MFLRWCDICQWEDDWCDACRDFYLELEDSEFDEGP